MASSASKPSSSSSRRSHQRCSNDDDDDDDDPEYVAIILAATLGTRLFPLTSPPHGTPKHLLPISPLLGGGGGGGGGAEGQGMSTPIDRLLGKIYDCGIFELVIIVIHAKDELTIPYLLGETNDGGLCGKFAKLMTLAGSNKTEEMMKKKKNPSFTDLEYIPSTQSIRKGKPSIAMRIRVIKLPEDCKGSADALRYLTYSSSHRGCNVAEDSTMNSGGGEGGNNKSSRKEVAELHGGGRNSSSILPPTSHALVMPGDLMLEGDLLRHGTMSTDISSSTSYDGSNVLSTLVEAHRRWNTSSSNGNNNERGGVAACTMLLTNVGIEDKDGVPIKESSKAKMNLFARNEEDVEYIALSSEIPSPPSLSLANLSYSRNMEVDGCGSGPSPPSRRVVLKRSKLEVEEDEGTGSTPKLLVARRLLHVDRREDRTKKEGRRRRLMTATSDTTAIDMSPSISLHTDLHDVHLYVISNWVFDLIHARPKMHSFQAEVLPLLISRQFKGIEAVFGPTALKEEMNRDRLHRVLRDIDRDCNNGGVIHKISTLLGMYASGKVSGGLTGFIPDDDDNVDGMNPAGGSGGDLMDPSSTVTAATPKAVADISSNNSSALQTTTTTTSTRQQYAVSAQVLSREASSLTLRTCTIPSLLYGCGEVTSRILKVEPDSTTFSSSLVAKGARLSTKFNSIIQPGCTLGEKVQTKSCTIGQNVILGDKAKLNNVVVMDGATIGSNTVLQQCIVGVNANIGPNCNLKDCQVGPGAVVKAGTKALKGEAFEA